MLKIFPLRELVLRIYLHYLHQSIKKDIISQMGDLVKKPDYWVGIESRGFIFASAFAIEYGGGVMLCRKAGKLPGR